MAAELAQEIASQSTNLQDRVIELEGQVSLLKFRLDALESGKKSHEDWVYSAPSISEEELQEMGYDEDAVDEMASVLAEMKNLTNKLRWGCCDKISLGDNIFSQMLKYHERLLPHWRELCDGIYYLKDDDELKCFDIMNVEVPNHIVSMILKAMRGKRLKIECIRFEYCNFSPGIGDGEYGIELASWLLNHSTVSSLVYAGDINYHEFNFRPLISAIVKHKSLRSVEINLCNGIVGEEKASKAGCEMLCSILENTELEYVSFQCNCLKVPNDASRMIEALKGCSKLVYLDISNNAGATGSLPGWGGKRNEVNADKWRLHIFSEVLKVNPNLTVTVGDFNANYQIASKK